MDGDCLIVEAVAKGQIEVDYDTGAIYSRRIRGKIGERTLLPGSNLKGYRVHKLHVNGQKKMVRAHRIVWVSVNGPVPVGMMIDHINRDKADNRLCNLRVVDPLGNAANCDYPTGENNKASRLTWEAVSKIRVRYAAGEGTRDLAAAFGISWSQCKNIVFGHCWKDDEYDAKLVRGRRKQKLRALGNAVVPQVVQAIAASLLALRK